MAQPQLPQRANLQYKCLGYVGMIEVPEQQPIDASKLPRELIEYLLAIGDHLGFKYSTLGLAIDIAGRYLHHKQPESKQLVLLTSVFIAAKVHDI